MAVAQCLDRGLDDDAPACGNRLADAEIDDVAAWSASCVARASTAKAFSSPIRSKAAMVFNMGSSAPYAAAGLNVMRPGSPALRCGFITISMSCSNTVSIFIKRSAE